MEENLKKEIVQRIIRNLTDIQILTLLKDEPMWGYKIKKKIEEIFGIKLRHGSLYSILNTLGNRGFVDCKVLRKAGRVRKVYYITENGLDYLRAYHDILKSQLETATC